MREIRIVGPGKTHDILIRCARKQHISWIKGGADALLCHFPYFCIPVNLGPAQKS